ncbi:DUF2840 domain-containing protein [Inquilinus limosus]|uniref:DUF2840 domain-containing protein n=1 Tax=Inquilinus limosus TaxID=171674 RepID=UPI003F18D25E
MSDLTRLELLRLHRRIEHWLRFGRPVAEAAVDQHRRVLSFAPGSVFAVLRWAATDLGTGVSRIDILRAVAPGEGCATVPHVRPGAEILLRQSGWPKIEHVLQAIDAVLALRIDPADAAPDHWRHVHNRLSAGFEPRPYSRERHAAWLKRRRIEA